MVENIEVSFFLTKESLRAIFDALLLMESLSAISASSVLSFGGTGVAVNVMGASLPGVEASEAQASSQHLAAHLGRRQRIPAVCR